MPQSVYSLRCLANTDSRQLMIPDKIPVAHTLNNVGWRLTVLAKMKVTSKIGKQMCPAAM